MTAHKSDAEHQRDAILRLAAALEPGAAGIVAVDGDNPPTSVEIAATAERKLLRDPVEKKYGRQIVVIDTSREDAIPDELLSDDASAREEFIRGCDQDITINLLRTPDKIDFGEMLLEHLFETGDVYDPAGGVGDTRPGHYDPQSGDPVPGENRAYVVVSGS